MGLGFGRLGSPWDDALPLLLRDLTLRGHTGGMGKSMIATIDVISGLGFRVCLKQGLRGFASFCWLRCGLLFLNIIFQHENWKKNRRHGRRHI